MNTLIDLVKKCIKINKIKSKIKFSLATRYLIYYKVSQKFSSNKVTKSKMSIKAFSIRNMLCYSFYFDVVNIMIDIR